MNAKTALEQVAQVPLEEVTFWAEQKVKFPLIGWKIRNPAGWVTDIHGASYSAYGYSLPEEGEIVEIGEYRDGAYFVRVAAHVDARMAELMIKDARAELV